VFSVCFLLDERGRAHHLKRPSTLPLSLSLSLSFSLVCLLAQQLVVSFTEEIFMARRLVFHQQHTAAPFERKREEYTDSPA
jgi:hypothetical protein